MQAVIEDTSVCDLQHAANWTDLIHYLEGITIDSLDVHVPLLNSDNRDSL